MRKSKAPRCVECGGPLPMWRGEVEERPGFVVHAEDIEAEGDARRTQAELQALVELLAPPVPVEHSINPTEVEQ